MELSEKAIGIGLPATLQDLRSVYIYFLLWSSYGQLTV